MRDSDAYRVVHAEADLLPGLIVDRYGDYLVVRNTWMPAALIESAYMILPRQEELVNDPAFQEKLAGAAAEGILEYFGAPHRPEPKKENK